MYYNINIGLSNKSIFQTGIVVEPIPTRLKRQNLNHIPDLPPYSFNSYLFNRFFVGPFPVHLLAKKKNNTTRPDCL